MSDHRFDIRKNKNQNMSMNKKCMLRKGISFINKELS